jgi:hypothetical protein
VTDTPTFTDLRRQFEPLRIGPKGYYDTSSECREAWDRYGDQDPTHPLSLPFQVARCERWLADVNRLERVRRQGPSSDGYKHQVERAFDSYVCNGAFIIAAIRMGFIVEQGTERTCGRINALVNVGRHRELWQDNYRNQQFARAAGPPGWLDPRLDGHKLRLTSEVDQMITP